MNFDLINEYAQRIQQGESQLHPELVKMCTPYFRSLRKRFCFQAISDTEITNELAWDAIADAFEKQKEKGLPYSFCLQNTFRKQCRARMRIIREQYAGDLAKKCELTPLAYITGGGKQAKSPQLQAEQNELIGRAKDILTHHDPFSKQIIYQKCQGSTYPELASIFQTTPNKCKTVYWHDINHLIKEFKPQRD